MRRGGKRFVRQPDRYADARCAEDAPASALTAVARATHPHEASSFARIAPRFSFATFAFVIVSLMPCGAVSMG